MTTFDVIMSEVYVIPGADKNEAVILEEAVEKEEGLIRSPEIRKVVESTEEIFQIEDVGAVEKTLKKIEADGKPRKATMLMSIHSKKQKIFSSKPVSAVIRLHETQL